MFCKECGKKHPIYTNYCPNDGQDMQPINSSLVEHKKVGFCASCGNSVDSKAQYCQHCGESHSTLKIGTVKKVSTSQGHSRSFGLPTLSTTILSKESLSSILIAVGLTILLTLLTAFFIKTQTENYIIDNSGGEMTASDIKHMDYLSQSLEYETGLDIDFPNIYNLFTYVTLIHSIDFEVTGDISAKDSEESYQETLKLAIQNLSLSLLLIAIFILSIGGLILGYIVKKNRTSLSSSIFGFSVIYGVFLLVSSFIASFTFKEGIYIFSNKVNIIVKGTFPLIESFFVGTILAASISGLTALLMVYGKDVFAYLSTKASYVQYFVYSTIISLIGITLFTGIYLSISGKYLEENLLPDQATAVGIMLSGPVGMWLWNLSHLIPLNFTVKESGDNEFFSLHLFSSYVKLSELDDLSNLNDLVTSLFFIEGSLPLILKASLLIPALLLIFAGFQLYRTHGLHLIELVKFSIVYGLIMTFLRLFSSVGFSIDATDDELYGIEQFLFQVQPNLAPVFIISAIFALVFISIGGYLKRYIGESA